MHRTHHMWRKAFLIPLVSVALTAPNPVGAQTNGNLVQAPQRAAEPVPPPRATPGGPSTPRTAGNQLVVGINTTERVQRRDKKPITEVNFARPNIATGTPAPGDPTTVLITGRQAGLTRVTLAARDAAPESFDVVVQVDVSYLQAVLTRAVPTANLQLIPSTGGSIVIAGNVNRSEDIDIIMRTAISELGAVERVVNAMRVGGVMQVQLDVVVAYVSRSELRRMSFDFVDQGLHHTFASTVGQGIVLPSPGSGIQAMGSTFTIPNTIGTPNGAPVNLFLTVFNDKQLFFGFLQALRNENLAKILAQPKLVTISGRSATLLSGGEQAIPEAAGLGSISVRFEPFGTRLSFLPIVLGNGKIMLEVEPEVSNIDPAVGTNIAGTSVPGRTTQSVHTTVEIEDGQTLAIGGLIQNLVTASTAKVPIVGDLPFIGAAFSSKSFLETETELVVLVTPHLVDPMACDQLPKLVPGQETRTPDDFELFLEGIMEAPRGPREVCPNGHYVPAYKNGPTAAVYPCAGNGTCGSVNGACGASCGATCTAAEGAVGAAVAPTGAMAGSAPVDTKANVKTPAVLDPEAIKPLASVPLAPNTPEKPATDASATTKTTPGASPSSPGNAGKEATPSSLPAAVAAPGTGGK
jgi:pilus assembly protein CpaC